MADLTDSDSNSPDLNYTVHAGKGPALLLVHGFLSSSAQWGPNLKALGVVSTPVTVDLFGHGGSPAPEEAGAYYPHNYLDQFERIRQELGARKWLLCGYSLGAGLTVRYALEYSHRVIAHCFTNSTSGFSVPREGVASPDSIVKKFVDGGLPSIEDIPVHPRFATKLPDDTKAAMLMDAARLSPGGIGRTIAYTNPSVSVRDEVQNNVRPALLVCGQEENRFQPYKEHLMAHMPRLKVVDVPAGHAVNAERADEFNAALVAFIKGVL